MFDVVLVLVVTAHLLAVAWAIAGPFVGLWLAWRQRRRGDAVAGVVGRCVLGLSLVALAAATVLGLAALGLLWLEFRHPYFDAAEQIPPRRYWFGLVELVFSFVCLAAAWNWWPEVDAPEGAARFWTRWSLTLLAATNLTYHFPPLFAVIGVYCTRPEQWGAMLPFTTMLVDPEVFARTLHHLLAAFTVTGATLATLTRPFLNAGSLDEARGRVAAWGGRIALAAVVGQFVSGTYLLIELPAVSRERLLGGDSIASLAFAASLLATVALLHPLAAASLGDGDRRQLRAAACLVAIVTLLMVATRLRTRKEFWPDAERPFLRSHGTRARSAVTLTRSASCAGPSRPQIVKGLIHHGTKKLSEAKKIERSEENRSPPYQSQLSGPRSGSSNRLRLRRVERRQRSLFWRYAESVFFA